MPGPLVYMSPRGLISILLFIQLKDVTFLNMDESPIDERLLLIVILCSMLVMLLGTIKKQSSEEDSLIINNEESPAIELDVNPQSLSNEETEIT
jgi:Tfp pilus assembly protein PilO